jgi:pilus assembly protein CpaE
VTSAERAVASERGQASVELVASLPFVLLLAALVWQFALAGHTLLVTAHAARAGARAELVSADVRSAARSAVPEGLRRGLLVERSGDTVRVRVRMPVLLHRWQAPVRVGASSSLEGDGR